jgi:methionine-S-sulfoxide reductase
LWHVFTGEQSTAKNTRYCVNSLSLKFIPNTQPDDDLSYQTIVLGWWCFRCVEGVFQKVPGVIDLKSWYTGGKRAYPSYEQVTTGATGHIEVVKVVFDPAVISLEEILSIFLQTHDPTSVDKQWHDEGSQYRSAIFTTSQDQQAQVQDYLNKVSEQFDAPIVTEVRLLETFWIAEDYHQNFFERNPNKPYCQLVVKKKREKAEQIIQKKTIEDNYWKENGK